MNMNHNGIESFTTQESIENTLKVVQEKIDVIGKNPAYADEVADLKKTLKTLEEKVAISKN
jgi:hypothetical protein